VRSRLRSGEAIHGLEPYYIRHKGRDGSLVGWWITLEEQGPEVPVTVRVADFSRLRSEAERFAGLSCSRSPWIAAAAFDEDAGVLLIGFPFDRSLRALRHLVRVSRLGELFKEHLSEVVPAPWRISTKSTNELVRYKPERRAVLRWDLYLKVDGTRRRRHLSCYFRLHADATAARANRMMRTAADAGMPCPQLLAQISESLSVESAIPGQPLDLDGVDAAMRIEAAGEMLGRLHEVQGRLEASDRVPSHELDRCRQAVADLHGLDHESAIRAAEVTGHLARTAPAVRESAMLHGDFHPGQILFDGDAAALVDFDRSHRGQAAYDLANFEAHLFVNGHSRARELSESLKRGYGRVRTVPDEPTLDWHLACALLSMASTPFRELKPDWPERTRFLVDLAAEVVKGKKV
jgi:Ser/Thr protein kinase RdoA (MazF antagonist)